MRRKILLQEDKLAKIESTNKMRHLDLQERFEEKDKLELEVSDLEKRKVDYNLQLQRATNGSLTLGLQYNPVKQQLMVMVDSARNLVPVNLGEKHSDPYVKVICLVNNE